MRKLFARSHLSKINFIFLSEKGHLHEHAEKMKEKFHIFNSVNQNYSYD